jgi:hypothetical protein
MPEYKIGHEWIDCESEFGPHELHAACAVDLEYQSNPLPFTQAFDPTGCSYVPVCIVCGEPSCKYGPFDNEENVRRMRIAAGLINHDRGHMHLSETW